MPIIDQSDYQRPSWMINRHLETILPSAARKIKAVSKPKRLRIDTEDGDFLDLDWYQNGSRKVLILSHGLEGDSERPYILGMINRFYPEGWDVIAWNYRGCSGAINKRERFYHSGATDDLHTMVQFAERQGFENICLSGFSLGGNLTLKYLGEYDTADKIRCAVVFSVPLDLAGCAREIDRPHNLVYSLRFLKSLKEKVRQKESLLSGSVDLQKVESAKSVYEFDDYLTAPLHGFGTADNYYAQCSSVHFVPNVKVPTLVVNAQNDPFLSETCFDTTNFVTSDHVYFEMPKFGGHVGFSSKGGAKVYWSEQRAFDFISKYV
ncbi:YheT family hydrolase [Reichenbachiella ulvae]|uniref:Alpha/beta fold hydrolase n=1 Tax=Reichenbachiella ulvae TaxID=2980104 RepID=A0ABT3CW51_9BACT|nr:alpha/beta fold hydrolase [Reichenbachiella ulvae]MCV9387796.1 alpha/beta fold hydrolase [Reichenbachiella ulvae]